MAGLTIHGAERMQPDLGWASISKVSDRAGRNGGFHALSDDLPGMFSIHRGLHIGLQTFSYPLQALLHDLKISYN